MHRLQSVTNNMQNSLNNLAEKANNFPLKGINEPDIKLFKRNMDVFKDYTNCYNYSIFISSQGVVDYFLEVLQNLYNEWLSTASFEVHHLIHYRHKTFLIIYVTEIICKTAFRDCMIRPSYLAWSMFHIKLFEPYKLYLKNLVSSFIVHLIELSSRERVTGVGVDCELSTRKVTGSLSIVFSFISYDLTVIT